MTIDGTKNTEKFFRVEKSYRGFTIAADEHYVTGKKIGFWIYPEDQFTEYLGPEGLRSITHWFDNLSLCFAAIDKYHAQKEWRALDTLIGEVGRSPYRSGRYKAVLRSKTREKNGEGSEREFILTCNMWSSGYFIVWLDGGWDKLDSFEIRGELTRVS